MEIDVMSRPGYLRINDGEPLTPELVAAVSAACDRVEDADSEATLVLHVVNEALAGDEWCPGDTPVNVVSRWEKVLRRVERLGVATVAVVEGFCSGPALEVLLVADYRIITPRSRLSQARGGREWWPGMVLHRLVSQLGLTRARQLVLFDPEISADRALELGLVDEVVDDPMERVVAITKRVGGRSGTELAIRRRLLLDATTTPFEESLGTHLAACDRVLRRAVRS